MEHLGDRWCSGPVFTKLFEIDFQSQRSLSFILTNDIALTKKIPKFHWLISNSNSVEIENQSKIVL